MILLKMLNFAYLLTCLLACFFPVIINGQSTDTETVADTEFPAVLSCSCKPTIEKCNGTILWDDGSKYEGEFRFGKLHGKGKLFLSDNCFYEGEFNNETFEGQGTMVYEDGSKYIGNWVQGYREGEGVFLFPDGREYIGAFEMDQFHGEGAMVLSSGEIYSGTWENGAIHGFGTITKLDGSKFIGMNTEGTRDGAGMVVWESGDTLFGSWQNGKMTAEGTFQFADGSTLVSFWEDGVMKDENIYIKTDGERFTAATKELAQEVLNGSWDDTATIERNISMAFYSIGMEYKSMMDYDRAVEHLQYAARFEDIEENFNIKNLVETQLANIHIEKEKNGSVAKKKEEKD